MAYDTPQAVLDKTTPLIPADRKRVSRENALAIQSIAWSLGVDYDNAQHERNQLKAERDALKEKIKRYEAGIRTYSFPYSGTSTDLGFIARWFHEEVAVPSWKSLLEQEAEAIKRAKQEQGYRLYEWAYREPFPRDVNVVAVLPRSMNLLGWIVLDLQSSEWKAVSHVTSSMTRRVIDTEKIQ